MSVFPTRAMLVAGLRNNPDEMEGMRRGSSRCALRVAPGGQPWRGNFGGGNSKEQPWQATMAGAWRGATLACGGKPGGGTGTTLTGPANGRANRGKLAEASLALGGGGSLHQCPGRRNLFSLYEGVPGLRPAQEEFVQGSRAQRRNSFYLYEGVRSSNLPRICYQKEGVRSTDLPRRNLFYLYEGLPELTCSGGVCSTYMKGFGAQTCPGGIGSTYVKGFQTSDLPRRNLFYTYMKGVQSSALGPNGGAALGQKDQPESARFPAQGPKALAPR